MSELWKRVSAVRNEDGGRRKLTARTRLELLFDGDSFMEIDSLALSRCDRFGMDKKAAAGDGVIGGFGTVNGRHVYAYAQDVSVTGGSLGEMHAKKIAKLMQNAINAGAPVVALIESGGARIQEGVDALSGYGKIFYLNTKASGKILQISAIMGACAGGAVYSPALTDFIFMLKDTGRMFITGPEVIRAVTGEQITAEALGGAALHGSTSGVVHFVEETEESCIRQIRNLLGYYFNVNEIKAPAGEESFHDNRIQDCVPENTRQPYNIYEVIKRLTDQGGYLDYMKDYAANMVTCFARIGGMTVGIVANQPVVLAGCIDIDASDKAARFVRTCDAYEIPVITLADVPGFLPGVKQEHGGIIRHGAKMLYAYAESTVPKITLILRKAYGGAYLAMGCKELGTDYVFAWPQAEIAVMGADGAMDIMFRGLEPEEKQKRRQAYQEEFASPYMAAKRGIIDEVIIPGDSRQIIIRTLQVLSGKRKGYIMKKHGNIPL